MTAFQIAFCFLFPGVVYGLGIRAGRAHARRRGWR